MGSGGFYGGQPKKCIFFCLVVFFLFWIIQLGKKTVVFYLRTRDVKAQNRFLMQHELGHKGGLSFLYILAHLSVFHDLFSWKKKEMINEITNLGSQKFA